MPDLTDERLAELDDEVLRDNYDSSRAAAARRRNVLAVIQELQRRRQETPTCAKCGGWMPPAETVCEDCRWRAYGPVPLH